MMMTDLIPWRKRGNGLQVHREREPQNWANSLHREMNQLIDRFFTGSTLDPFHWDHGLVTGDFMPRVDVSETDKAIKVTAELPGMSEDDIDLTLLRDSLTIRGEKKEESEEKDKDFYRMERRYGSFSRVIPLSAEVDEGKVQADFKKGVLKITLPKTSEAQQSRKKIEIKSI
ncbi:Hsp20/alpha crystallin family protein [Planctomycetota bacterium]